MNLFPTDPITAPPGSAERIKAYSDRVDLGEALHQAADSAPVEYRAEQLAGLLPPEEYLDLLTVRRGDGRHWLPVGLKGQAAVRARQTRRHAKLKRPPQKEGEVT